jgi:hypothetical protein
LPFKKPKPQGADSSATPNPSQKGNFWGQFLMLGQALPNPDYHFTKFLHPSKYNIDRVFSNILSLYKVKNLLINNKLGQHPKGTAGDSQLFPRRAGRPNAKRGFSKKARLL